MATTTAEPKTTKRYQGLIKTAQGLFDKQEEVGWRLANVVHTAAEELRSQGCVLKDARDPSRMSALRRIASDINRPGFGYATIHRYYYTWKKYGNRRKGDLNFLDHVALCDHGERPRVVEAVKERRAYINSSGARGLTSDSDATSKPFRPASEVLLPYSRLHQAKSSLRGVLRQPMKDFPDLDKLVQHLDEIDRLLGNMYKRVEDYSAAYKKAAS